MRTLLVLLIAVAGVLLALRSAFFGLLFYLWVAYFRPEQWAWNGALISSLYLSSVAGVLTLVVAILTHRRWPLDLRVGLLAAFLIQALVSVFASDHESIAWTYWVELFKIITVAYLIVALVDDLDKLRMVLLLIALSLGLEAAKQGWSTLLLNPGGMNTNTLPNLGDNNGVAVGMLMLVPVLTALAATTSRRWEKIGHRLIALGVLARALSTYSRGGFLACIALGLTYAMRSPKKIPAVLGIVVATAIIIPVLPQAFWDRMATIEAPNQDSVSEDTSATGRVHFWRVAVAMAADWPLFGVGYNTFNNAYDEYDDSGGRFGFGCSVHSSWFGVLGEMGYPGLVLFLLQFVFAIGACRRARRASNIPGHEDLRRYAFALEAGFVAFGVGGSFVAFQYTEILWHYIAMSVVLNTLAKHAIASATVKVEFKGISPGFQSLARPATARRHTSLS